MTEARDVIVRFVAAATYGDGGHMDSALQLAQQWFDDWRGTRPSDHELREACAQMQREWEAEQPGPREAPAKEGG